MSLLFVGIYPRNGGVLWLAISNDCTHLKQNILQFPLERNIKTNRIIDEGSNSKLTGVNESKQNPTKCHRAREYTMKYIQRKRKERLVDQWVEQGGLPAEEVTPELVGEPGTQETGATSDNISSERLPYHPEMIDTDRRMVRLQFMYILIGLSIMGLLLVSIAVLITILIMQP